MYLHRRSAVASNAAAVIIIALALVGPVVNAQIFRLNNTPQPAAPAPAPPASAPTASVGLGNPVHESREHASAGLGVAMSEHQDAPAAGLGVPVTESQPQASAGAGVAVTVDSSSGVSGNSSIAQGVNGTVDAAAAANLTASSSNATVNTTTTPARTQPIPEIKPMVKFRPTASAAYYDPFGNNIFRLNSDSVASTAEDASAASISSPATTTSLPFGIWLGISFAIAFCAALGFAITVKIYRHVRMRREAEKNFLWSAEDRGISVGDMERMTASSAAYNPDQQSAVLIPLASAIGTHPESATSSATSLVSSLQSSAMDGSEAVGYSVPVLGAWGAAAMSVSSVASSSRQQRRHSTKPATARNSVPSTPIGGGNGQGVPRSASQRYSAGSSDLDSINFDGSTSSIISALDNVVV